MQLQFFRKRLLPLCYISLLGVLGVLGGSFFITLVILAPKVGALGDLGGSFFY